MAHKRPVASPRDRVWRVVLLFEGEGQSQRENLQGIRRFAAEQRNWVCRFCPPERFLRGAVADWPWDGILLQAEEPARALASALKREPRPVVSLSDTRQVADWPCVSVDNAAVASLAADYLLHKQVRTYGFAGADATLLSYVAARHDAFKAILAQRGIACESLLFGPGVEARAADLARIAQRLQQVPKPIAIFVANDSNALDLVSLCETHKLRIPDDVLLLGVDNDELLCELSHPPLSSIAVPTEAIGYRAAALLADRLAGRTDRGQPLFMAPRRVVARRSSDLLSTSDPLVRDAQRLMDEQLMQRVNVKLIAQELKISRRLLEKRFHAALGHAPHEELLHLRITRAEALLQTTDKTLAWVAQQCGFRDASHLSLAFRRQTGQTPSQFRGHAATHLYLPPDR